MNTKKVAELLAEIDQAQDAAKELAKEATGIAKKIAVQNERVATLKRALADELAEVVAPSAGKAAPAPRRRGVTAAVLEALADGQPHATRDIAVRLTPAGFGSAGISVTLSLLARKGSIARVSRGVYRLAVHPTP